jgi:hypothetical protein
VIGLGYGSLYNHLDAPNAAMVRHADSQGVQRRQDLMVPLELYSLRMRIGVFERLEFGSK